MAHYASIQQPIHRQFGASTITMTNAGVTITIARCVWTPRVWKALVALLVHLVTQGVSWVSSPSWIPPLPGQPRWKHIPHDGLTRLAQVMVAFAINLEAPCLHAIASEGHRGRR